jgi:signal transduction histidine kinase
MEASKGGAWLGLFITYGLVRELHGDISAQSKFGEGTPFTFTITLPTKIESETQNESVARG